MVEAIRKVNAGERYMPPALREAVLQRYVGGNATDARLATLTDREVQVLRRLAEGATNYRSVRICTSVQRR